MIHIAFPLIAAFIYLATPKGCYKTLNWILTGLFILIWAFDETFTQINKPVVFLYDGLWFDSIIFGFYALTAYLFYNAGGKIQYKLSLIGVALCIIYAGIGYQLDFGWVGDVGFRDYYYYTETMIALYIAQLFIAGGGMMLARINNITIGQVHGLRNAAGYHRSNTGAGNVNNGDPRC